MIISKLNRSLVFLLCSLVLACGPISEQETKEQETAAETPVPVDGKYLMQGKIVAQTAASALTGELTRMLSKGDMEQTIRYCNLKAIPVTDSVSFLYKAHIKRTSGRVRNPHNAPDALEAQVLAGYAAEIEAGRQVGPSLGQDEKGNVRFYAPILAQAFCLNCHGTPGKELTEASFKLISELYPDDRAIGYQAGDFRGMWSITFEN